MKRTILLAVVLIALAVMPLTALADDVSIDANGNVTTGTSNSNANLEVTGGSGEDAIVGSASGTGASGVYGVRSDSNNYGILGFDNYGVYGYSSGGWAGYFQGRVNVTGDLSVGGTFTGYTETDPQVGTLANGKWCTSNGTLVNCTTDQPVLSESDPSVNALGKTSLSCSSGQVVKWNGSAWACANDAVGAYSAGTGLNLTGTTFSVQMPLLLSGSESGSGILNGVNDNASGYGMFGYATYSGNVTNYGGFFQANGNYGSGVWGTTSGTSGRGVYGSSSGTSGKGVEGIASGSGDISNYGGYFTANGNSGYGVYGGAGGTSGRGVYGTASGTSGLGVYGVHGSGNYGYLGSSAYGVYGQTSGALAIGVSGKNTGSGLGVYGESDSSYGVLGRSLTGAAVYGLSNSSAGVYGESSTGSGGYFTSDSGYGLIVDKGNVGMGTLSPSSETKVHIQADNDNFGVLVDSLGVTGSEIGLHSGAYKYASLVKNAYYTTGAWQRFDTGSGAFLQEVEPAGAVKFKVAGAGANPVSWATAMILNTVGNVGIGTTNPTQKLTVRGNILIQSSATGASVAELGEGLDYAEGFNISDMSGVAPGTVLIIDPDSPGKLAVSTEAYDSRVAGIVAGAGGLGSGVRLGADRFDSDVALAGRVYCNVDTTYGKVSPGDLLTTSPTPGYAMVVKDHAKALGAILGKAMEKLPEGQKGQILVLVTLQ